MISISIESSKELDFDMYNAVSWCIKRLMPRLKNIDIIIDVLPLGKQEFGYASREASREFEIELNSRLRQKNMLKTLFHEMVHIKQYVHGDLKYKGTVCYWKNVENNEEYKNQPWEIEAFKLEELLYDEYINSQQTN